MPDPKVPEPSEFAKKLSDVALAEHKNYARFKEHQNPLKSRIAEYWAALGLSGISPTKVAWSAAFVSWCVRLAGATKEEFTFAQRHSQFVHDAIQNELNDRGVFRGKRVESYAPRVGDIIQNNREGGKIDYDRAAKSSSYQSHSAIVVEKGEDADGKFVRTIGGNEANTVGRKRVPLNADGTIRQKKNDSYICVIQCLK